MGDNGKLEIVSGRALRLQRSSGEVIALSGETRVRIRSIPLDALLLAGKIPDLLTPMAVESLWAKTKSDAITNSAESTKEYIQLVNLITSLALVEPRVVDDPHAEDEIAIDDLDLMDRQIIFNVAIAGAEALRNFRKRQTADVDALSNGQDVQQPTVADDEST